MVLTRECRFECRNVILANQKQGTSFTIETVFEGRLKNPLQKYFSRKLRTDERIGNQYYFATVLSGFKIKFNKSACVAKEILFFMDDLAHDHVSILNSKQTV